MDFSYSDELLDIKRTAREFAEKEIQPHIMEWDEKQYFPMELFHKMGEHGLMGILVPQELGGSGLGYKEYVTALVEISKVDGSIGLSMAAHNSLCTNHILTFGNKEQKEKYLGVHIFKKRPDRRFWGHFFCFQLRGWCLCQKTGHADRIDGCSTLDGSLKIIAIIQIRNRGC